MKGQREKGNAFERFRELETKTDVLLDTLAVFDQGILDRPGKDGGWSAMQVLSHLMQSEQLSCNYVKKKLSFNPTLPDSGLITTMRGWTLRFLLSTGIKIGAPKGLQSSDLKLESGIPAVRERWAVQREKMRLYLEGLEEEFYMKAIYKHPLVGRLSLSQMVGFFGDHLERHARQIESRLKE